MDVKRSKKGFLFVIAVFAVCGFVMTVYAGLDNAGVMSLSGKHIAFLVGEGFHDGETYIPMAYLINRGAKVTVIGVEATEVKAYNSDITIHVQKTVNQVDVDDFDAMVIPGGHSPGWLRQHEAVVDFVKEFFETGKITAAICHGPQVLVATGLLDERTATCFPGMADELTTAGVHYVDVPVQQDGNLITSRIPDDIPVFSQTIEKALK